MAGMTLANYRTKLLLDLDASATEFPTANIDRAVERAVQDLSRIMPNEDILDISINDLDITDEAFTTHGSAGTHISLANSPLQPGSERVYKASDDGTTYQRGTDYEIDYDAGTIAHLAGGDLSNSTAYSIDYDKSRRSISLSNNGEVSSYGGMNYSLPALNKMFRETSLRIPISLFTILRNGHLQYLGLRGISPTTWMK